jgi:acetyltransferase AlgX (SGNH hydrolase-like protein)
LPRRAAGRTSSVAPEQLARVEAVTRSPEIDLFGRGNLDAEVHGPEVTLHGWAVGTEGAAIEVEILEGGDSLVRMPIALPRPDVVEALGDLPGAADSGFMASFRPRRSGRSSLEARVHFADGSEAALGLIEVEGDVKIPSEGGAAWEYSQSPPGLARVLVGRDGWLFLRGDSNDSEGQHAGRVTFDDQSRAGLERLMCRRAAAARDAGAIWLTAVVPDKEILYREQLPVDSLPIARRPVHEFLEIAAGAEAPAIYLLDDLEEAKSAGDLYMRIDTHWNHLGAYFASLAICRELDRLGLAVAPVEKEWIEWLAIPFEGDLGGKLPRAQPGVNLQARLARSWSRRVYDNEVRNHGRVMVHEQDRQQRPSCLVFGESFAETLLYFLKESFGRVVFAHTSMFIEELVELERPDVVLSLPIERFLIRVPSDEDALARFAETARGKGGEVPWPVG